MKKTFFAAMTVIAISASITVGAFNSSNTESELFLAGTEALAQDAENEANGLTECIKNCEYVVCTPKKKFTDIGTYKDCMPGLPTDDCTPDLYGTCDE